MIRFCFSSHQHGLVVLYLFSANSVAAAVARDAAAIVTAVGCVLLFVEMMEQRIYPFIRTHARNTFVFSCQSPSETRFARCFYLTYIENSNTPK